MPGLRHRDRHQLADDIGTVAVPDSQRHPPERIELGPRMAPCTRIGQKPMRVYDCRHAAATTWLRAGMPLAETARRLGQSVETLVTTYVGALDDEEHTANQRIDTYLQPQVPNNRPPTAGEVQISRNVTPQA
ncbi:MAG: hypothetical protein ABI862_03010 [Ilumatobacteraceae bacterium]